MKVTHKKVSELTSDEYRRCYRLNFRSNGDMQSTLHKYSFRNDGLVVMIEEGSTLIGWALLTPIRDFAGPHWLEIPKSANKKSKYSAMLYVRAARRGQGYGRMLLTETQKVDPIPYVWVTKYSTPLYAHSMVQTSRNGRNRIDHWLKY